METRSKRSTREKMPYEEEHEFNIDAHSACASDPGSGGLRCARKRLYSSPWTLPTTTSSSPSVRSQSKSIPNILDLRELVSESLSAPACVHRGSSMDDLDEPRTVTTGCDDLTRIPELTLGYRARAIARDSGTYQFRQLPARAYECCRQCCSRRQSLLRRLSKHIGTGEKRYVLLYVPASIRSLLSIHFRSQDCMAADAGRGQKTEMASRLLCRLLLILSSVFRCLVTLLGSPRARATLVFRLASNCSATAAGSTRLTAWSSNGAVQTMPQHPVGKQSISPRFIYRPATHSTLIRLRSRLIEPLYKVISYRPACEEDPERRRRPPPGPYGRRLGPYVRTMLVRTEQKHKSHSTHLSSDCCSCVARRALNFQRGRGSVVDSWRRLSTFSQPHASPKRWSIQVMADESTLFLAGQLAPT